MGRAKRTFFLRLGFQPGDDGGSVLRLMKVTMKNLTFNQRRAAVAAFRENLHDSCASDFLLSVRFLGRRV